MENLNLENFKSEIHRTLISKLDLEKLSRVNSSQARQAVSGLIKEIMSEQRVPLNFDEQERIHADLLDEVFGLGPLEPLLRDPKISDILVNDKDHVFVEKGGLLQKVNTSFRDDRHLMQIIDRIVSRVGRRVDEEHIAKALSRPVQWKIPSDYVAVRRMQNEATPLTLEESMISRAIRDMARAACGMEAETSKKKKRGFGLFG